ncbi:hypothetical protein [Priestia abyssalis]|uniref:hypothetical protein n=1 Tax=Priestia abyssalis TaxID=1221450 RepID=UPI000994AF9D|nr:hypothetical protein [Priestia abyssalis]
MNDTKFVWGIFVANRTGKFPNFFPVGIYSTHKKAEEELKNLPRDNNYQLLKLPIDSFFGYFNKSGDLVGMDAIHHEHFDYRDEEN